MDKEDVAHIYNGILLRHKRSEIELFAMRWMDLESVIQSDICQKEKNKYCKLTHIYGIKKKKSEEPRNSTGIRYRCREWTGERGEWEW